MKKIILISFLLLAFVASAQRVIRAQKLTDHSTPIFGDIFDGIVFSKGDGKNKYPTLQQVLLFENAINFI